MFAGFGDQRFQGRTVGIDQTIHLQAPVLLEFFNRLVGTGAEEAGNAVGLGEIECAGAAEQVFHLGDVAAAVQSLHANGVPDPERVLETEDIGIGAGVRQQAAEGVFGVGPQGLI